MNENDYIIEIDESRQPHNAYLLLPLAVLEQLTPLLMQEIMQGLASTKGNDKVVLHLFLNKAKINEIRKMFAVTEHKIEVV